MFSKHSWVTVSTFILFLFGTPIQLAQADDTDLLFRHVGNIDPQKQGWTLKFAKGGMVIDQPKDRPLADFVGQGEKQTVPSWYTAQRGADGYGFGYCCEVEKQAANLAAKGWVLDVIARAEGIKPKVPGNSACVVIGVEGKKWEIVFEADKDGIVSIKTAGDGGLTYPCETADFHHIQITCAPNQTSATVRIDGKEMKGNWKGSDKNKDIYNNKVSFGAIAGSNMDGKGQFALILFSSRK